MPCTTKNCKVQIQGTPGNFSCHICWEVAGLLTLPEATTVTFWMCLSVSCMLGPVLTYSSMLSTTYNSPLATAVTGNTKDLAITFIGKQRVLSFHLFFLASCVRNRTANQFSLQFSLSWSSLHVKIISYRCSQLGKSNAADNASAMCFNDFQATFENVLGFFLSFLSAALYSGIKLRQSMNSDTQVPGPKSPVTWKAPNPKHASPERNKLTPNGTCDAKMDPN